MRIRNSSTGTVISVSDEAAQQYLSSVWENAGSGSSSQAATRENQSSTSSGESRSRESQTRRRRTSREEGT